MAIPWSKFCACGVVARPGPEKVSALFQRAGKLGAGSESASFAGFGESISASISASISVKVLASNPSLPATNSAHRLALFARISGADLAASRLAVPTSSRHHAVSRNFGASHGSYRIRFWTCPSVTPPWGLRIRGTPLPEKFAALSAMFLP